MEALKNLIEKRKSTHLSGIGKCSTSVPLVTLDALWGGWRRSEIRELWLRTTGLWCLPTFANTSPFRGPDRCPPLHGGGVGTAGGGDDDGEELMLNIPSEMGGSECLSLLKRRWSTLADASAFEVAGLSVALRSTRPDGDGVR